MKIAVIATEEQFLVFKTIVKQNEATLVHCLTVPVAREGYDAIFDCLFQKNQERLTALGEFSTIPVFINCVANTLFETNKYFIRFNGWNSFLQRPLLEVAVTHDSHSAYKTVLDALQIAYTITPDIAGFVTARVVSMIINEAYLALGEEISTKAEIDIAMKLGTNYPYGPFEWASIIGIDQVYELLHTLGIDNPRYNMAISLVNEYKSFKN
jgi:3-hydroxybutyryl-CoA dehydrogenase